MITGLHTLLYATDPEAARAFFRDVLRWPHVDAHAADSEQSGWLIFDAGPAELAAHPLMGGEQHHEVTLMCDDLDRTMAELSGRGARFMGEPEDVGFGRAVRLEVPGAGELLLYQPSHPTAAGGVA